MFFPYECGFRLPASRFGIKHEGAEGRLAGPARKIDAADVDSLNDRVHCFPETLLSPQVCLQSRLIRMTDFLLARLLLFGH